MSQEGANIVYGSSAAIAFLTVGGMQCHENGMAAVRAAREERELDRLHAYYAAKLAEQASLIDTLRGELEKQAFTATAMKNAFDESQKTISKKNMQLSKLVSALEKTL